MMSYFTNTRVQVPAIPVPESNLVSQETYDQATLNSSERVTYDGGDDGTPQLKDSSKFMRCKRLTIYSTLNARTLSKQSRQQELLLCFKQQKVDILSVQEHRLYHPDSNLKYTALEDYQLITSSATKNSQGSTIGGVGILLSPRASDNLLSVEKISNRIIIAEFNSNPTTTLIACYSPTNVSEESDVDTFYQDLRGVVESVPAHNFLVVAGDFNSHVGRHDVPFSYHEETNRNGIKLLDFAEEFQLDLTNTKFMKKPSKLWTFKHPSGTKSQIDFILTRKKWKNSIRDAETYSTFSSVGSDHRVVSIHVYLSLRSSKKATLNPLKAIDWEKVSSSPNLRHKFAVDVKNRFDALSNPSDDIETKYNNLIKSNEEVALTTLPKRLKKKETPLRAKDQVKNARANLLKAQRVLEQKHTKHAQKNTTKAQNALDEAYATLDVEYIQGKIDSVARLHTAKQHAASWRVINDLAGRKEKPSIRIKGGSPSKRKSNWLSHFKSLLGNPPKLSNTPLPKIQIAEKLNIETGPFTLDELNTVIKSLSNNKSPGLDNIPTIIWKDSIFHHNLLEFCNHTLTSLSSPTSWLKGGIIPVPKKGDLTSAGNYRGITLTPIAAKIFNKLLLNRIVPAIDPLLRRNQNGFRRGRSTISQILAIRRILEEMKRLNKDVTLCFVDFRKAFDSVSRDVMFEILSLYGIPPQIIGAIKALYTNTSATIISSDGETELFDIIAGVLQGDTLAPFLFIIVLDYALRISVDKLQEKGLTIKPRQSSRHPAKTLTDLDFADDLALISESIKDAELLLQSLESAASQIGLYCNEDKTQFISTSDQLLPLFSLNNTNIKRVDDFKYLGSWIAETSKDFKIRKALAWDACNKLDRIWKSNLSNIFKVHIFSTLIEPVLLYGSETWTLSAKLEKRLDGCYTNLLRRVQNISWRSHSTLKQIYGGLPSISIKLRQKRLQFAGHCHRATGEVISSLLLWRPAGRVASRKLTFIDTLVRDTGIELSELGTVMQDRNVWREHAMINPSTPVAEG